MFSVCFQDSVWSFQISLSLRPLSQTNVGSTGNLEPGKMADSWGVPWWSPPEVLSGGNENKSSDAFLNLQVVKNKKLPVSSEIQFLLMRVSVFAEAPSGWGWGREGTSKSERCGYGMDNSGLRLANKITVKFEFWKNNEYVIIMSRALFGTCLY